MLIESPRRQSAEESSRWGRSCLAVRGGSRVHLEPRASAMGACPRRGAWLCSVGLLGALALLPRALLALPLNLDGCFPPGPYPGMKRSAEFISRLRFPFNITVTFVCQPGYTLSKPGPLLSTCQDDGTWSPVSGSCNKPPCSYPVNFENGHAYVPTDTSVGSIIMYYCDEGYTLIGDVASKCEFRGGEPRWSGVPPLCYINNCGEPLSIENGKHSGGYRVSFDFGEVVTYHCNSRGQEKFTLIGNDTIICDKDGEWDKLPPKCKEVKCKTPKVDNAVQLTGFGSFHGYKDTVDFKCEDGYFFLLGNGTITCEADSNWSPVLPFCSTEHAYTEPPYPSRPGPSLPPNKEPQGFGIIIVIVLTIVIVFSMISFIAYRRYKEK